MTKAERNDVLRDLVRDASARQRGELCAVLAVATAERLGADDQALERVGWAGRLAGALGPEGARRAAEGHAWLVDALADPLPTPLLAALSSVWPDFQGTEDTATLAAMAEVRRLVQPVGEP